MRTIIPKKAKLIPEQAERVFKGVLYDVSTKMFEMLRRIDTIKVIAVKYGKIVVIEQQQPDVKMFFDIPGGMHDEEGETEIDAAKRELREETGLVCKEWKLVDVYQVHNKIEQLVYTFLAHDILEENIQALDSGEKITPKLMNLEEVKELMKKDEWRPGEIKLIAEANSIEDLISYPEYTSIL